MNILSSAYFFKSIIICLKLQSFLRTRVRVLRCKQRARYRIYILLVYTQTTYIMILCEEGTLFLLFIYNNELIYVDNKIKRLIVERLLILPLRTGHLLKRAKMSYVHLYYNNNAHVQSESSPVVEFQGWS